MHFKPRCFVLSCSPRELYKARFRQDSTSIAQTAVEWLHFRKLVSYFIYYNEIFFLFFLFVMLICFPYYNSLTCMQDKQTYLGCVQVDIKTTLLLGYMVFKISSLRIHIFPIRNSQISTTIARNNKIVFDVKGVLNV